MDTSKTPDPHARPKPHSFYAPKPNSLIISLVQRTIRRSMRRKLHVTDVEISDDDLAKLRALQGRRCLLTPSHSGGWEPHVLMCLSAMLGDYFHYVAALEVFEQSAVNRWIMPRLGCYSILRGTVDRSSFSMTRKILAAGKRWLVIFPEGEAIGQNAMLVPFQQGVFQLAFKGLDDARNDDSTASLYCVPMAIKYVYLRDMTQEMNESLARVEECLTFADNDRPADLHARLRRVCEAVLAANETARGVKPPADSTMDQRIQAIKQRTIEKLEHQFDIKPPMKQMPLDRIRTLFNTVDRIVQDDPPTSAYEQQLQTERARMARATYDELWRLLKFVAVYDGYVSEALTVERFMDILGLLEHEVLNNRRTWGPRKAIIRVGEPVDLADRWESYEADRRTTVTNVCAEIESQVRELLAEIGRERETPMT
ncbi:lysophospholipid acyltransferase family protein [Aeoliella sp.]|uniref:lysophospholipid acyltransferase family protein n=1 Tax=Aeoliella sp. TaxID=2795800 RepID=UPI003CCC2EF0